MADHGTVGLAGLPPQVRERILGLTAEVLPVVPRLPATLRKVAEFAPARRARLGASAMADALDADDEFRERVAVHVGAKVPAPTTDLTSVPLDADPVEVAALAWLTRTEGWESLVATAVEQTPGRAAPESGTAPETQRWRAKAEAAELALREARARHRAGIADLKAENTTLRRRLGEARSALREAVAAAGEAGAVAEEARRQSEDAAAAQDRELRQLRAQVQRLQADATADRRSARADRDEATLRARLLLETVIDAASGLRRELSLPPVTGAPADRVERELAAEGARTSSATGSLGPSSPALLDQYLAMPRTRLIVDGYNVSKTAWPSSPLEAQRIRLLNGLAPLVARTGVETTVVFDAAGTGTRPVVQTPRGVKVLFSPQGTIADDVIRDLVAVEPEGRVVVVVTSDQELSRDAARCGARCVSAEAMTSLLGRSG